MGCFWRHDWGAWSKIIEKSMAYEMGGQLTRGIERVQRRTCVRCNEVQEREL